MRGVLKSTAKRFIDRFNIEDDSFDSAVKLLKVTVNNPDEKQRELEAELLNLNSLNHGVKFLV